MIINDDNTKQWWLCICNVRLVKFVKSSLLIIIIFHTIVLFYFWSRVLYLSSLGQLVQYTPICSCDFPWKFSFFLVSKFLWRHNFLQDKLRSQALFKDGRRNPELLFYLFIIYLFMNLLIRGLFSNLVKRTLNAESAKGKKFSCW